MSHHFYYQVWREIDKSPEKHTMLYAVAFSYQAAMQICNGDPALFIKQIEAPGSQER